MAHFGLSSDLPTKQRTSRLTRPEPRRETPPHRAGLMQWSTYLLINENGRMQIDITLACSLFYLLTAVLLQTVHKLGKTFCPLSSIYSGEGDY